ncbi:acylneuraminate cytidylyltransferase family protein [Roseimaritima sediminicola]|uniref:acylneuraminate cytidylyltransferase family protein n=1 Tax=Roseimaritima sediminicola TaxID=2662066 RepID=UPI001386C83C|nr:NTP transferase domain-containing protein [Roseimaritima sediminicola]
MNVAIVTARAGSKSIINKNIFNVCGRPLIQYPLSAANDAQGIDKVFVSTDGEEIARASRDVGAEIIPRPEELSGDTVNHGDVIKHAVEWVDERHPDLQNVVLLLGNTVQIDGKTIDLCLQKLDSDPTLDSCMTVWQAQDDHPLRALEINDEGLLETWGDKARKVSTERQSYAEAYYYDQGVWAFRKHTVQSADGPSPWWWMGKRSAPVVRTWVTGRDVHTMFDIGISEWWAKNPELIAEYLKQSGNNGL